MGKKLDEIKMSIELLEGWQSRMKDDIFQDRFIFGASTNERAKVLAMLRVSLEALERHRIMNTPYDNSIEKYYIFEDEESID